MTMQGNLTQALNGGVSAILEVVKQVEERIKVLEEKEKHWEEVKKDMSKNIAAAKSKIVLDVGGKKFATSKATLLKYENTYFSNMLACACPDEDDGSYFIDRSPKYFSVVIEYMRGDGGALNLEEYDSRVAEKIKKEFQFYKIPVAIEEKIKYLFSTGKTATMPSSYVISKGTLLQKGKHTWKVKVDNVVGSNDVGVAAPSHPNDAGNSHFNRQTKTAWGLRENGYAHYTPNTKVFDGYKSGDIIQFNLDLDKGTLEYIINGVKLGFTHTDVVAPVHVAFSGGQNAKASIID